MITHASVFSGIGGPEVAAAMLGWINAFHCEINPFGRAVLDYWFPNSKSYEDITKTDFTEWRGRVDVLTGGFPCQPFSYAGQRRGADDDRYLWPYMYRCIDQVRPTWVVAENVAGILTMVEQGEVSKLAGTATLFDAFDDLRGRYELRETFTLQRICTDLESHGYAVQPVLVPACAVGAPHRRDRVFIVARRNDAPYPNGARARDNDGATCDKGRTACEDWRESLRQGHGQTGTSGTEPTSANASADTIGSREGTPRPSGCIEGGRGDTHQQSSERRAATEWTDRLYAILRPSADSDSRGLSQSEPTRRESEYPTQGAGMDDTTQREGENGNSADTIPEDSMHSGFIHGQYEEQGSERNIGNIGAGGSERLCGIASWFDDTICGKRWDFFPSVSPVCGRYDGLSRNVVRYINDKVYDELKEHFRNEDLSSVWQVFQSPQVRQSLGRLYKIHETDLLLKVVFGAQTGRRPESDGDGLSARSDEVSERVLRKLRKQRASSCASQRLQHQEQLTRELGYALPALSFDLALAAKTIEEEVLRMMTYVRTEALKAYGNAIVPQVMYEIFRAIQIVSEQCK